MDSNTMSPVPERQGSVLLSINLDIIYLTLFSLALHCFRPPWIWGNGWVFLFFGGGEGKENNQNLIYTTYSIESCLRPDKVYHHSIFRYLELWAGKSLFDIETKSLGKLSSSQYFS